MAFQNTWLGYQPGTKEYKADMSKWYGKGSGVSGGNYYKVQGEDRYIFHNRAGKDVEVRKENIPQGTSINRLPPGAYELKGLSSTPSTIYDEASGVYMTPEQSQYSTSTQERSLAEFNNLKNTMQEYSPPNQFLGTSSATTPKATLWGPNGQREIVDIGSGRASQLQSQGWGLTQGSYKAPVSAIGSYRTNPEKVDALFKQYLNRDSNTEEQKNYSHWNTPDLERLLQDTADDVKGKAMEGGKKFGDNLSKGVDGGMPDYQGYEMPDYSQLANVPEYQMPDYSQLTPEMPSYQMPDYNQMTPSLPTYQMPDYNQMTPNLPTYQMPDYGATRTSPTQYQGPNYQSVLGQYGATGAQQQYESALGRMQETELGGMMLEETATDQFKDSSWALGMSKQELDKRMSDPESSTYVKNPHTRDKVIDQAMKAQKATIGEMMDKVNAIYGTLLKSQEFAVGATERNLKKLTKNAEEAYKELQWISREQYQEEQAEKKDISKRTRSDMEYASKQRYQQEYDVGSDIAKEYRSDAGWAAKQRYGQEYDVGSDIAKEYRSDAGWASKERYKQEYEINKELVGDYKEDMQWLAKEEYKTDDAIRKEAIRKIMQDVQWQAREEYGVEEKYREKEYDYLDDVRRAETKKEMGKEDWRNKRLTPNEAISYGVLPGTTYGEAADRGIIPSRYKPETKTGTGTGTTGETELTAFQKEMVERIERKEMDILEVPTEKDRKMVQREVNRRAVERKKGQEEKKAEQTFQNDIIGVAQRIQDNVMTPAEGIKMLRDEYPDRWEEVKKVLMGKISDIGKENPGLWERTKYKLNVF